MAAVTSLGIHQPAGLHHAVQEGLIAADAPASSYTWDISIDDTDAASASLDPSASSTKANGHSVPPLQTPTPSPRSTTSTATDGEVEDELLVASGRVVWSRGGILRKSFNFALENEPITQALLAYFPASNEDMVPTENLAQNKSSIGDNPRRKKHDASTGSKTEKTRSSLSKAIVVFLKTQAHVYFLSGTSHVIHMPFEVEAAFAAPIGVIIQGRAKTDGSAPVALRFPKVPPNSFVSSQLTNPFTGGFSTNSLHQGSQGPAFSTAGLGKLRELPLRLGSTSGIMWDAPLETDSKWPRLMCLTDPYLDLGTIVTEMEGGQNPWLRTRRKDTGKTLSFLGPAEEMLHIEQIYTHGAPKIRGRDALILIVTTNRDTSTYTIWRLKYIDRPDPFLVQHRRRTTSGAKRRRSSMPPPFVGSESNTPIHTTFRESLGTSVGIGVTGSALPSKRPRRSERHEPKKPPPLDIAATLEGDKEAGVNRRTSRRISSMLARADLSASQQERGIFDQAFATASFNAGRRTESFGRVSAGIGGFGQVIHPSLNSLLEAPIDSVLDELRATGDFESFHHMGLDDDGYVDGLHHEMLVTKIQTITLENSSLRYSLSDKPARTRSKVFILPSPLHAVDEHQRGQIVVGIQDCVEKRLLLVTLPCQTIQQSETSDYRTQSMPDVVIAQGNVVRAQNVIDSTRISDGDVSMILILSESESSPPLSVLSIQAPWSHYTTLPLTIPVSDNTRSLYCHGRLPDRDTRQVSETVDFAREMISGLSNPMKRGVIDIVDRMGRLHQLRVQLSPTCSQTKSVLDACRSVLPASISECLLAGWWQVMQWLRGQDDLITDREWSAAVILLLSVFSNLGKRKDVRGPRPSPRKRGRAPSGSFGKLEELDDWRTMELHETPNSLACPPWLTNTGWEWVLEEDDEDAAAEQVAPVVSFISRHIQIARMFVNSPLGEAALDLNGYLPTASSRPVDTRRKLASDMFMAMHLLLEEQALDIMRPESTPSPGRASLRALMGRLARWLGWTDWVAEYRLGVQEELDPKDDSEVAISPPMPPPPSVPSVLGWIHSHLAGNGSVQFPSLSDVYRDELAISDQDRQFNHRWDSITPRTAMFRRFFNVLPPDATAVQFVEAIFAAGLTKTLLESLPESLLVPLQDALYTCQPLPPTSWPKDLLELVNRSDISLVLSLTSASAARSRQQFASNILTPTHNATRDYRSLCQAVEENNQSGYDEGEGADKQAIIRAIFSQDRRLHEANDLLATHKARVVRLDPQPGWSDTEYLERQKELVMRIALGTLAIPAGRALLQFGLRYPLLTQKLQISNFNMNCLVRPMNVTVGVDRNSFTEDKVCWGFFHQGVAAGLAISPNARGIDTSWILYNKPGQDLSNRHAGFLLGLGLNGHLKHVAKWVAFKYLTPKHTMTSIGLLLGLAASYIGTMDSLITRLLSVHATRMLPRGSAELNLSPLMQTSGIMGIGLLYANSQHRRMSEIMMSEIEHVDDEDEEAPLRNECYRLAAGFSLGFINLAKGNDLRGLHDMKLTEKLISLATATKKVEIVHMLDRAAAGAVVAIALIFMKSEDQIVARKVDAPDSVVQFDYIRPDILLLRTVAKNVILWSRIMPTFEFIESSLPMALRGRGRLDSTSRLCSSDLALFSILAGTCFSIALRFAGSSSTAVRELLVHYLDQFMRITRLETANVKDDGSGDSSYTYDEELTRNNAHMCQDVVALSAGIVMAGTGDLVVLRRLRALHGRDDANTTYGSHLAAHLAIGALFLGSGTATFGTSDMAVAALLCAFYPVFPSSVMDNRSHLQALRHFWVLATERRCLVAKDVVTGQPISVPVSIRTKNGQPDGASEQMNNTPCLLPPLSDIISLQTDAAPMYWDTTLDFTQPPLSYYTSASSRTSRFTHSASNAPLPVLYLRRRPFPSSLLLPPTPPHDPISWIFALPALKNLSPGEKAEVLDTATVGRGSSVDARMELEASLESGSLVSVRGVRGVMEWVERRARLRASSMEGMAGTGENGSTRRNKARDADWWVRSAVVEDLKGRVWALQREQAGMA